ncbi:Fe-only nitrogenase accessory AnfO family protein [Pectinatus haikarae]|uniref:Fe-only nitrogenase accessory protein AnfO n=1 Tax=Pectinatus haikarae TaxID=349096 RepID=A0ABT9YAN8_9FIRM|nr:Fe-only nitrogenase accessory AnfO family protein [Pectinatus haikarae]MDQ0204905.1 Fe-only nitrogenase accessory protein AnfO [Pectinatus haikarae]
MRIAALVDNDGRTIAMNESGNLILYEQDKHAAWHEIEKCEYSLIDITDAAQIRKILRKYISTITDCHILLAKDGKAIYRMIFEDAGYHLWRLEGIAEKVLWQVAELEHAGGMKKTAQKPQTAADYHPVSKGRGHYFIDICEVMSNHNIHSSDVLIPFLEKRNFEVLEINCTHIPRWFENVLEPLELKLRSQYTDSGLMKVFVSKK